MIEAYRISVTRNIFDVSRTLAFEILNVFRLDRAYYWSYIVCSKTFFLIDSFISSRRLWTSHVLSVPSVLTLECVRIFDPYLVFLFYCLPDDVLCKIAIWTDDTPLNPSCDKQSDLSQQVEIWKCNTRNIIKRNSAIQLYIDIWEIILHLQANSYRLKTKNMNNLIFINTMIK